MLPVHLLGPTPMTLGSASGVGPGASVGAIDPGPIDLTVHRHKIKIEAPEQEIKKLEEPTNGSEGTKTKIEEPDIIKKQASLAGQASPARGEATPRRRRPRRPDRA